MQPEDLPLASALLKTLRLGYLYVRDELMPFQQG
jgi:hypothetical protein